MERVFSNINAPRFLPNASEVERRRDFIWYCREHEWPEEVQDAVLRQGTPSVENALALIKIHGPKALEPILEMGCP